MIDLATAVYQGESKVVKQGVSEKLADSKNGNEKKTILSRGART
jgi:hypothetical protein